MLTFIFCICILFLLLPVLLRWAFRLFMWYGAHSLRESEKQYRREYARQKKEASRRQYTRNYGEYAEFEELSDNSGATADDNTSEKAPDEQFSSRADVEDLITDAEYEEL